MKCSVCELRCSIPENGTGICGMYVRRNGVLEEKYPDKYLVTIPAAIEAMPLTHYHPKAKFLQVGTIGCNFKCPGCVSWVLTESTESIDDALTAIRPEDVVKRALDEECRGIMFCFNEPAVSFMTYKKIAALAREKGLLAGCATNGYFTEEAFSDLLDHSDFINIGIKGYTEETYRKIGALNADPVYRNLALSHKKGIHVEAAAVFIRGCEAEIKEVARRVASVSKDIPFQVMRFIPLGCAHAREEPTVRESEMLCDELRKILKYVYLFNSPGTNYLDTDCPDCGGTIIKRGFNGPMNSNITWYKEGGKCECGFKVPLKGSIGPDSDVQLLGFFGGYRTIHCLESIQTVLAFFGESDSKVISRVLHEVLRTDYIKGLYERMKRIDSYLDTVSYFAELAGRKKEAEEYRKYIEGRVDHIKLKTAEAEKPGVYVALGHPLIAVFGDKFECNLVETAGAFCVNRDIKRDQIPGIKISGEILEGLNPDIIIAGNSVSYPIDDFYSYSREEGLTCNALKNRNVHDLYPYRAAGRPDWILGFLRLANIIHPEIFSFDLEAEEDEFYGKFLGVKLSDNNTHISFHTSLLEQKGQR